jgi:chemotaxis signal transduction protein
MTFYQKDRGMVVRKVADILNKPKDECEAIPAQAKDMLDEFNDQWFEEKQAQV